MNINAIRNEMVTAAKAASDTMFKRFGSTDQIGACGFAWVTVRPANKGNTKLGKAERMVLKDLGFRQDWTGKAYQLWDPAGYGGQNIDIKEASAAAAAAVLKKYGFNAYADSRLD